MDVFDIAGRHAVVMGMGGIGREIALGLADHGVHVAAADLDGGRAAAAAEAIRGLGVNAIPVAVQITDEQSVRRAADEVLEAFPRVDILVNAAGVTMRMRAEYLPVADWRRILDVNATGSRVRHRPDPLCRWGPHGQGLTASSSGPGGSRECLTCLGPPAIMFASWIRCSASRALPQRATVLQGESRVCTAGATGLRWTLHSTFAGLCHSSWTS